MPDPGVSLIPRGSKSTKKKRTSFRPAAKKSNQTKNKAKAVAKKAEESSTSITDVAASQPLVIDDSVNKTTITDNNDASNTSQSPPTEKNSIDNETSPAKGSISPRSTRSSSSNTTRSPSRKRKSTSLNNKISIGSSLRRRTETSNDVSESPRKDAEAAEAKDEEGKENEPKALEAKKHALSSTHPVAPAFSAHDQDILNRLASEEKKEDEGKSLNAFCTPFKGPRRKLKDKEGAKNNPSKKDRDTSSAAANNRVDASTTGAPSVQIVDGEIVLQESSVMLPSRRTVQEVEEEFRDNIVEEDEQLNIVQASYTSFVTKGDHGKTRKKGSWTIEETEKFYFALRQLGTDFGSMEVLFFENVRTRKQLKNKYRKELAKNPDLVQELALNPKYQTQLDMTALNLEVDPKRIEAHENEEPPAYEPTDEVEDATATATKQSDKADKNQSGNDYNGVFEGEVVEEDAEEERLVEARALEERNNKAASEKASKPGEPAEDPGFSNLGEATSEDGPSMDDFFGDSYGDDEHAADESLVPKKKEPPSTPTKKETSERVSLVPKKTNSKTRRPKIRPSRRKK